MSSEALELLAIKEADDVFRANGFVDGDHWLGLCRLALSLPRLPREPPLVPQKPSASALPGSMAAVTVRDDTAHSGC